MELRMSCASNYELNDHFETKQQTCSETTNVIVAMVFISKQALLAELFGISHGGKYSAAPRKKGGKKSSSYVIATLGGKKLKPTSGSRQLRADYVTTG